ncbi:MAG: hypothetical protein AAGA48_36060 [Myxococcota bacterium]
MDPFPMLELPEEAIWLFLIAVLGFLATMLSVTLLFLRRPVPTALLVSGPLVTVVGTWFMSQLAVDPSVIHSPNELDAMVVGFGATLVAGPLFALPTFVVSALGFSIAGARERPWDTPSAFALVGLGVVVAALVGFGAAANSGNPMFAQVRGVTYLLLTALVGVAGFEAITQPNEEGALRGAGPAAAVLPVLWLGLAEAADWGFAFVFIPNQPPTLDAATCVATWPQAVDWLLGQLRAELFYTRAAFFLAVGMVVVGVVKRFRTERDIPYAAMALIAVVSAGGLWGGAMLDQDLLLGLSALCPTP